MYNYKDLSDIEFEDLACDVMSRKLSIKLNRFAQGKDGGIDLADSVTSPTIIVQVKRYINTPFNALFSTLKKEVEKVKKLNPKSYYIVCSCEFTPDNIKKIYNLFADFMDSEENIISIIQIEDFLRDKSNNDILTRHYKLWLCSIDVITKLQNNDIDLDSEVLRGKIDHHRKYFVQTEYFNLAKDCLEKNKVLILIGEPGVGKSITSEMLTLDFMEQGYEIRHTTDAGNVSSLKKALSRDPNKKEFIYLDDCFGQCYFKMKETQVNELHSLMSYIRYSQNKILLVNSRVTIYNEALGQHEEFSRQIEEKELKVHIIDMSNVAKLDKAKILYNHLFFSPLADEYKLAIKKNHLYRSIINHKNYSPRIIEYITKASHIKFVKPSEYASFILGSLNKPEVIWQNEYDIRLQTVDRMLLNVLYSLTDTFVPEVTLKKCFNSYISKKSDIDQTIDNWRLSLKRLVDSFLQVVYYNGQTCIGVINPSVNDFFRARITKDSPAHKDLVLNINSVMQALRLLEKPEEFLYEKVKNTQILEYAYNSKKEKTGYITYAVCSYNLKEKSYQKYIQEYLQHPFSDNIMKGFELEKGNVLKVLFNYQAMEFYDLGRIIFKNDQDERKKLLRMIFSELRLYELVPIVKELSASVDYFDLDRQMLFEMVCPYLQDALEEYDEVEAENIIADGMIANLVDYYTDEEGEIDTDALGYDLEEELENKFKEEFSNIISELPEDIRGRLDIDKLNFYVMNVDQLVEEYFDDYDYDYNREDFLNETVDDEIDYIFAKI